MANNNQDISEKQLNIAYWYVNHKLQIRKILIGLFIAADVIVCLMPIILFIVNHESMKNTLQEQAQSLENNMIFSQYTKAYQAQKLKSTGISVIKRADGNIDAMAKITNPNTDWYVKSFDYKFIFGDQESEQRTSFILPGQEKYVMAFNIAITSAGSARLEVSNIIWQRILKKDVSDIAEFIADRTNIEVVDIEQVSSAQGKFSKTVFTITNNTAYNYWDVDLSILLYQQSKLVGISSIKAEQLLSGEKREIEVGWTGSLPSVNKVVVDPRVDVFNPDSYMEFAGEGEVK